MECPRIFVLEKMSCRENIHEKLSFGKMSCRAEMGTVRVFRNWNRTEIEKFKTEPNRNRKKFEDPWTEPNRTDAQIFQTEPNRTEKREFLKLHQNFLTI